MKNRSENGAVVHIRVHPGSKRNSLEFTEPETVRIKLQAPPR